MSTGIIEIIVIVIGVLAHLIIQISPNIIKLIKLSRLKAKNKAKGIKMVKDLDSEAIEMLKMFIADKKESDKK